MTLDPSWPPIVLAIIAKRCEKKIRCLCVGACLVTWRTFSFWWHCCGYLAVTVIRCTEWQLCVLTLTVRQRFRMIFPIICRGFCCLLVQLLGVLTFRLSYSRNHDNGQLPPHTPCHFFVSPSPFSTTAQQWVGHPELFISVKWKSSWILNISSEVVANLVFYFFLLFLFLFYFAAQKSSKSHCRGVSKVNWLPYLVHIFIFSIFQWRFGKEKMNEIWIKTWNVYLCGFLIAKQQVFVAPSDLQDGRWLLLAFLIDQLSFHSHVVFCGPSLSSCPVCPVVWSAACSANQWCWLPCSPAANKRSRTLRTSPVWKHAREGFWGDPSGFRALFLYL